MAKNSFMKTAGCLIGGTTALTWLFSTAVAVGSLTLAGQKQVELNNPRSNFTDVKQRYATDIEVETEADKIRDDRNFYLKVFGTTAPISVVSLGLMGFASHKMRDDEENNTFPQPR